MGLQLFNLSAIVNGVDHWTLSVNLDELRNTLSFSPRFLYVSKRLTMNQKWDLPVSDEIQLFIPINGRFNFYPIDQNHRMRPSIPANATIAGNMFTIYIVPARERYFVQNPYNTSDFFFLLLSNEYSFVDQPNIRKVFDFISIGKNHKGTVRRIWMCAMNKNGSIIGNHLHWYQTEYFVPVAGKFEVGLLERTVGSVIPNLRKDICISEFDNQPDLIIEPNVGHAVRGVSDRCGRLLILEIESKSTMDKPIKIF